MVALFAGRYERNGWGYDWRFCGIPMTRVALVVGINTYDHFRPLKAPAKDAEAIAPIAFICYSVGI